jgi:alpha-galactosidase/6-phospho-beta-glucosidase family protein
VLGNTFLHFSFIIQTEITNGDNGDRIDKDERQQKTTDDEWRKAKNDRRQMATKTATAMATTTATANCDGINKDERRHDRRRMAKGDTTDDKWRQQQRRQWRQQQQRQIATKITTAKTRTTYRKLRCYNRSSV